MAITYNNSVFINCPFDDGFKDVFHAIIFTVYRCGFVPRSALEEDNALNNRLSKIERIIRESKYGIHDISRTEVNDNQLPRFNMPFELGIFFGAKSMGDQLQKKKVALVLEREKYLYQQYISDLNGIDTKAHGNDYKQAIRIVRDWLKVASKRKAIDGPATVIKEYDLFVQLMPDIVHKLGLDAMHLTFIDYCNIVEDYLQVVHKH